jgi:predicted aspartyl protease
MRLDGMASGHEGAYFQRPALLVGRGLIATHPCGHSEPMRRRHPHRLRAALSALVALSTGVQGGLARAADREIPLVRDGAVYRVPVTLDGWLVRPFIVDTGAGEVQVSTDVVRTLFPRGSAPPTYLPSGTYRLADGRLVRTRRILIPSLRVGDVELHQVAASIEGPGVPLLLGQNVLTRLGEWSIDNRRGSLVLRERPGEASRVRCANWRTAPSECEVGVVRDFLRDVRPPHVVSELTLLRSNGVQASVFADVIRKGHAMPVHLCGPMDLHRAETGWRVVGASGLRQVAPSHRCRL